MTVKKKKTNNKVLVEKVMRSFLDVYDLEGANFYDTPRRVAQLWDAFLTREKPAMRAFPSESKELAVVKDYTSWGFCPHHLLPVEYKFKVGYIPNGKVVGLSKIPRLVDYFLARMPLQEDLPGLIVDELERILKPLGSGCTVEGQHLCCVARGIKSKDIKFTNTALRGVILLSPTTHNEFLRA
jgi:GTP cyclohydrolase I